MMRIGSLDTQACVAVVAEIGNNHEGDLETARRLVDAAAAAGADGVKFQTFRTEWFTGAGDEERLRRLRSFELPPDAFTELADRARALGLLFLSTPLDLGSAAILEPLVDAFKVASGDNDFWALLERVAATGKPVIVSSGASDLDALRRAVDFLRAHGAAEVAVLHTVSAYPAPAAEANLRAIPLLAEELGCTVGYSDHVMGLDAAVAAVALGARIVEKHFTLDKAQSDFRDHRLSADPGELAELVRRVRATEELLGTREKRLQPSERAVEEMMRRSIVAARDLPAGHVLEAADLTWMRPAGGLRPGDEDALIGQALRRPVSFGEPIAAADVG